MLLTQDPLYTPSSPTVRPAMGRLLLTFGVTSSLLALFGCEVDQEEDQGDEAGAPISCAAAPTCGPDQREVERCDESYSSCEAVSLCDQTVYCEGAEDLCLAVPTCDPDSTQVESCEGAEGECNEVEFCGEVIYCEELEINCTASPACTPDSVQLESCEGASDDCYEVERCGQTTFCDPVEINCSAFPICAEDEIESQNPCLDNGEQCREERECGSTIYCRPALDESLSYCDDRDLNAIVPDSAQELRIEGDELQFSYTFSGGCAMHFFPGCFSEFAESAPVQVNITLAHESDEPDFCEGIVDAQVSLDLTPLREAYLEAYPGEGGEIIINIVDQSTALNYTF